MISKFDNRADAGRQLAAAIVALHPEFKAGEVATKPLVIGLARGGVPVAPLHSTDDFAGVCDEFICPNQEASFFGVGQFYKDFGQVEDQEVVASL